MDKTKEGCSHNHGNSPPSFSFSLFFTSIGNKSRVSISFLFHQRKMLRNEYFFVYIFNTKVRRWGKHLSGQPLTSQVVSG